MPPAQLHAHVALSTTTLLFSVRTSTEKAPLQVVSSGRSSTGPPQPSGTATQANALQSESAQSTRLSSSSSRPFTQFSAPADPPPSEAPPPVLAPPPPAPAPPPPAETPKSISAHALIARTHSSGGAIRIPIMRGCYPVFEWLAAVLLEQTTETRHGLFNVLLRCAAEHLVSAAYQAALGALDLEVRHGEQRIGHL